MLSEMQVMDKTGHTTVNWDPDNDSEVRAARDTFDAMKAKGYSAFYVKSKVVDQQGRRMDTFDRQAEKVILVPPLVGG